MRFTCPDCDGSTVESIMTAPRPCPTCRGRGEVEVETSDAKLPEVDSNHQPLG